MAATSKPELIERVRVALRPVPDVIERRMFGSIGFMIRGKLAMGVRSNRIMCRVDPKLESELLKRPGCSQVSMKGRTMKGYVHVDRTALTTDKSLGFWIGLVLERNRSITNEDVSA